MNTEPFEPYLESHYNKKAMLQFLKTFGWLTKIGHIHEGGIELSN